MIEQSNPPLTVIHDVTPDLLDRLRGTVVTQTLQGYRSRHYHAKVPINRLLELEEMERMRSWINLAVFGEDVAVYSWQDSLAKTLHNYGYCLSPDLHRTVPERVLLVEYAAGYGDALDILISEFREGQSAPLRRSELTLNRSESSPTAGAGVMMLSAAIKEFLEHLPPAKRAMNEKHGFILPAFLEVTGDMPITDLRQTHLNDFLRIVQKLPPRWSEVRRRENKNIRELAAQGWDETLSLKTYDGSYRASLRMFLERAMADWQDIGFPTTLTTSVPYVGARTKTERKQRALRQHEIELIFFNEKMEKIIKSPASVHKFWLLAIELYTGARVREICQINPQYDWGCRDGHWWLRFTDDAGEKPDPDVIKSVKTGKSRTIPMHEELVRLGLPKYLDLMRQNEARRLFPQWAPTQGDAGAAPGKWVANYMRSIGLHGVVNEQGNAVRGSHTFRHTLLTHGRKNGVNLRCISGHSEATDNPVADGYEDETVLLALSEMASRLVRLDYGVVLPAPVGALAVSTARRRRVVTRHQESKLPGREGA